MSLLALLFACTRTPSPGGADSTEDCTLIAWYIDRDGDGYGSGSAVYDCRAPSGHVRADGDCDDINPAVYPGADEICNGQDDDCDGVVDPTDLLPVLTCYWDVDEDGWGIRDATFTSCACPEGYATQVGDCNDADALVHPGSTETWYDGVDQDCADDDDFDADGDGWPLHDDCADADPLVNPEAAEICGNGIDDDCDGLPGACGIEVEWDVVDARLEILSMDAEAYVLPQGTVADMDGDGLPELAMGWWTWDRPSCAPGGTFFEVHVTSLAATGTEAVGDRSLARLVAPVDCRPGTWRPQPAGAFADHDFDGDGFEDMLVAVSNFVDVSETTVPSRLYLSYGPFEGAIDLSDAPYLSGGRGPGFLMGGGHSGMGMGVAVSETHPVHTILVTNMSETDGASVWFIAPDVMDGGEVPADAPSLDLPGGWSVALSPPLDLDGDGVSDMLIHQSSNDESNVGAYFGPFDRELTMEDADATLQSSQDPSARMSSYVTACPTESGHGMTFVWTERSGSGTSGRDALVGASMAWPWASGVQDLSDSILQLIAEDGDGPTVKACSGDMDANGEAELVLSDGDDNSVDKDTSRVLMLAELPEPGTWYADELVRGQVVGPADREWTRYSNPQLIADVDFTGDGADDLVIGLGIEPSWYEPVETGWYRTLVFPGSLSGL